MPEPTIIDAGGRDILLRPEAWRMVVSGLPFEVEPIDSPGHVRWMKGHSHAHAHVEVLLVLAGEGHHGWGDLVFPVQPGTVLVFGAMQPHDVGYRPSAGTSVHLWLSVLPEHVMIHVVRHERARKAYRNVWYHVIPREAVGVDPKPVISPWDDSIAPDVGRAQVVSALSVMTTSVVAAADAAPAGGRNYSLQQDVVRAITAHIRETAGKGVTLDSVARIAGYSPWHFHRVFRAHVGLTLHQYIDVCRQDRARELTALGYSKRAISEELGFSHPTAYSRWKLLQRGR